MVFALLGAPLVGCQPGIAVDVHNRGPEELVLVAVGAGGERREERLAVGEEATLGGALAWHVVAADGSWSVELPHPGPAHVSRTLRARYGEGYRFQVEGRCVFALAPDERPPVQVPGPQPSGYPAGACPGGAASAQDLD